MKSKLIILALFAAFTALAGENPFEKGYLVLSPYASYNVRQFDGVISKGERLGGGMALQYHIAPTVAIEGSFLSEGLHWQGRPFGDSFTDASLNVKSYFPVGDTGLAPYVLVGYTRGLREDVNRMNAGAGIELRAAKLFNVFADGQWTHDFQHLGHALFRVGLGVRF